MSTPTITDLKATPTDDSFALAWGLSTEETVGAIRVYLLPPGGAWETVADLPASARSYAFTGLSSAAGYKARVRPLVGGEAAELSVTTLPTPAPPAPVLSVEGETLSWVALPGVTAYTLATIKPTGTTYSTVEGTGFTPPAVPGETVEYGLTAHAPVPSSAWSNRVSITYPATPTPPTPPPAPAGIAFTPGLNSDGAQADVEESAKLGAKTVRIAFEVGEIPQLEATIAAYRSKGISVLPLLSFYGSMLATSSIPALVALARAQGPQAQKTCPVLRVEFGNETSYGYQYSVAEDGTITPVLHLETGEFLPHPRAQYGDGPEDASYRERARTYALRGKELAEALKPTGVGVLFQAEDAGSGSPVWVNEMFAAVPNLPEYVDGWTIHPYPGGGTVAEVAHDSYGIPKLERMIADLKAHSETSLPIDASEWGVPSANGVVFTSGQRFTYKEAAEVAQTHPAKLKAIAGGRLRLFLIYGIRDGVAVGSSTNRESFFGVVQRSGALKAPYTEACEAILAS